jgi:hypothetical protein
MQLGSTPAWICVPRRSRHSRLNRLRLRNTRQMVDLANQSSSLLYAGELANPLASAPALALVR